MMRRGICNVPADPDLGRDRRRLRCAEHLQPGQLRARLPDGAVLTLESSMLNVLPVNMMAIAMGLHVRCGIEDNIWTQRRTAKMSTVEQIEQLVRISREFGREIATGKEAREIYRIGEFYGTADETLAAQRLRAEPRARPAAASCATRPSDATDVRGRPS